MDSPRDSSAFEVRDALLEPGCPICSLALRSVGKLLQSIAYEQVNDVDTRAHLRRAGGFCNTHAYRWLREAHNVLGTAIIYRDVIKSALRELEAASATDGLLRRALRRKGSSGAGCPACHAQSAAEDRYVSALLAVLEADDAAARSFEASTGLCRRHTLAAARRGGPAADLVVGRTRRSIEALLGNLDEVIRKEDYRFRQEPRSDVERAAPAVAIAWSAGEEGLT